MNELLHFLLEVISHFVHPPFFPEYFHRSSIAQFHIGVLVDPYKSLFGSLFVEIDQSIQFFPGEAFVDLPPALLRLQFLLLGLLSALPEYLIQLQPMLLAELGEKCLFRERRGVEVVPESVLDCLQMVLVA